MSQTYTFPCGCSFPVLGPPVIEGGMPLLDFRTDDIPEHCPAVWEWLAEGKVKGVFQLEGHTGKRWTQRLRPEKIEHVIALVAIQRPGVLHTYDDEGVSMTEHFCRRKNGEEEVPAIHPIIDRLLKETYGALIYQEDLMSVARELCDFDLAEVEALRRSVAKKKMDEVLKVGKLFMEKGLKAGKADEATLNRVWETIKASGRYLFVKAHAASYGIRAYQTAYDKCHSILYLYTAWLSTAHLKKAKMKEEKQELVNDAESNDIGVYPPDLRTAQPHFFTDGQAVFFGVADLHGVGGSGADTALASIEEVRNQLGRPPEGWSWLECLVHFLPRLTKTTAVALIQAGAFRWLKRSRRLSEAEYGAFEGLTKKERSWAVGHVGENPLEGPSDFLRRLGKTKKEGGGCHTASRASIVQDLASFLDSPPSPLVDAPHWLAAQEESLLGVSLSCSRVDACDITRADSTCKEVANGKRGTSLLAVEVVGLRLTTTKRGKNPGQAMAILNVKDGSGALPEVVIFPDAYAEARTHLCEKACLFLQVDVEVKKGQSSVIVKKVWPAPMTV